MTCDSASPTLAIYCKRHQSFAPYLAVPQAAVESNAVALAILFMIEYERRWTGTATELSQKLPKFNFPPKAAVGVLMMQWQLWADLDKDFERSESTDGPEMDVPSGRFLGSRA